VAHQVPVGPSKVTRRIACLGIGMLTVNSSSMAFGLPNQQDVGLGVEAVHAKIALAVEPEQTGRSGPVCGNSQAQFLGRSRSCSPNPQQSMGMTESRIGIWAINSEGL